MGAKPTGTDDEQIVWVRRQWDDSWRKASYRPRDIWNIHWDWVGGGVQAPTPQPFLHGYVSCRGMLEGELAHSGSHGPCPHVIKVCIVKKDNPPSVFSRLAEAAGPKPAARRRARGE